MKTIVNFNLGKAALLSAPLLAAIPQQAEGQSKDPSRPNILCVVTEDISCYLGCYGDPNAKSPNLDRFASEAIRFTNMHTPNGVSSPSRFAIITGMYPSSMGANYMRAIDNGYEVCLPDNMKAFTEYLREAGYFCTAAGKTDYQIGVTPAQWDENGFDASWKNCPEGTPFYSVINIMTTHESQIWSRKEELEVKPEDIDMSRFPYLPDDPIIRNDLARVYTNIAIMDREAQAYFDEIENAGIADNTIIIWYSDNGGPIPRGKRSIYNTGTNVPFMVKFPDGYRAGEVEDRLVSFIDIPATIMSLAGVTVPEYMHGKPFLGNQAAKPAEYIYAARDRYGKVADHSASVRDKRFHYVRNYKPEGSNYLHNAYRLSMPMMNRLLEMRDAGELNEEQMKYFNAPRPVEEFYDLLNDPYELNNLADDPAFKYDFERLKTAYEQWNNTINREWNTMTEEEWKERFRPKGQQIVVEDPEIKKTADGFEVSCATPGASIVYKITDKKNEKTKNISNQDSRGTNLGMGRFDDPSKGWNYYTGKIKVEKGKYLVVKACRAGYKTSNEVTLKR